ncbi:hypothetical protein ACAW74_28480 [Fibrella sp. WM1]|uniref:hypothetical protein n=1 Tax=Fibrella musci TaxID=3242485 RepID=UPI0035227EB2
MHVYRFWLLLFCLITPALLLAQPHKTVKKRSTHLSEQFDVLADNDTVRDGTYEKRSMHNRKLLETGQYKANKRVGVWTFYGSDEQPELIYDYDARQVKSNTRIPSASSVAQVQEGDSIVTMVLDNGPVYLASSPQIYGIIARTVRLPINLQRAGVNFLSFKVLATVSISGARYRVIASNQDKEFLKSCREAVDLALKDVDWAPARYRDQPVTATYLFEEVVLQGYVVAQPR